VSGSHRGLLGPGGTLLIGQLMLETSIFLSQFECYISWHASRGTRLHTNPSLRVLPSGCQEDGKDKEV